MIRSATHTDRDNLATIPEAALFLGNEFLVALQENRIAAFLAWRRLAAGEAEILQLLTLPDFQRRGLARALLQTLKKQEPGDLFLEVRAGNTAARQLYEKELFTEIGVRQNYYSSPVENAIVLRFHPC